jgi:hypothetical protein
VDGSVTDQEISLPNQLSDDAKIGGIAAHKRHAIIDPVMCSEFALKRAMDRALAGDMAAPGRRNSVSVDRFLRSRNDPRVSVETQIIVGGKIDNFAPVNPRARSRASLVHAKVWGCDPNLLPDRALDPQFIKSRERGEIGATLLGGRVRERGRRTRAGNAVEQGNSGQEPLTYVIGEKRALARHD